MASQVGSGFIAIWPSMRGFKRTVSKETQAAGSEGAKRFSFGFKRAGTEAGRELGSALKRSVSAAAGRLAEAELRKLKDNVATAARGLSNARLKQQDETGRLRAAEAKLNETREKYGAGTSQVIAAEERLASARRKHQASVDAVTSASEKLKEAQGDLAKAVYSAMSVFERISVRLEAAGKKGAAAFARGLGRVGELAGTAFFGVVGAARAITSKLVPVVRATVSAYGAGLRAVGGIAAKAFGGVVTAAKNAAVKAGRALGEELRNTATATVGAAATSIGYAFGKGFQRLQTIDTAQAKLRGLGASTEQVSQVMADSLASVRGTAFGLGEAVTVAAGAMAAGITPGVTLEKHLKAIANNAAAAGVSMEDMGSIINKAATQANGVQNDVIGQLADRGLPIYQKLADILGVTSGEVFDLASQGKVSFDQFAAAATAAAGTVADEMGKTVPGATKNMLASLARIGANALGGLEQGSFYSKLGPLIGAFTAVLGRLEEVAKRVGARFNEWAGPRMDKLLTFFTRLSTDTGSLTQKLKGMLPILAPLGAGLAALGAGGLSAMLSSLGPIAQLVPGLSRGLGLLGSPIGALAAAFGAFVMVGGNASTMLASIEGIVAKAVTALPGLVSNVTAMVPRIVSGILAVTGPLIDIGAQILTALVSGIAQALPVLLDGAGRLVMSLGQAILVHLPLLTDLAVRILETLVVGIASQAGQIAQLAGRILSVLVGGLARALPTLIDGALLIIESLALALLAQLPLLLDAAVTIIEALAAGFVTALPMLLDIALRMIETIVRSLLGGNLQLLVEAAARMLDAIVRGVARALPVLIPLAVELLLALIEAILENLPMLIASGVELIAALIQGMVEAIPLIVLAIPDLFAAFGRGLEKLDWAELGVNIVEGIIGGVLSMGGALIKSAWDLGEKLGNGFKKMLGINSPSTLFYGYGVNVVEGAVLGVDHEAPALAKAMQLTAQTASDEFQAKMNAAADVTFSSSSSSDAATAAGGTDGRYGQVSIQANFASVDPATGVALLDRKLAKTLGGSG